MGEKVAFTAVEDQRVNFGPFETDQRLIFKNVITNIGGAFQTSGIFKAPVNGVYYFSFSYRADKEKKSGLTLMKGNDVIVRSFDNNQNKADDVDQAGNVAVLQLDQGDQVYVMLPAGYQIYATGNTTSFTGFLLFKN